MVPDTLFGLVGIIGWLESLAGWNHWLVGIIGWLVFF